MAIKPLCLAFSFLSTLCSDVTYDSPILLVKLCWKINKEAIQGQQEYVVVSYRCKEHHNVLQIAFLIHGKPGVVQVGGVG